MPVFLRDLEATPCCRDASMKDPLRGASNQSAALTHSYRCTFDALKRDKLTRRKTDYMWSVWGRPLSADVRFGSKADMCGARSHVRFAPESDIKCDIYGNVRFGPKADIVRRTRPRHLRGLKGDLYLLLSDSELLPETINHSICRCTRWEKAKVLSIPADEKDEAGMVNHGVGSLR